jgi:hypothetical protein
MFLEYGVNEHSELIHIDQAGRGLTQLSCPYCGGQLLARKGSEKIHHFAHAGETCREVSNRSDNAFHLPLYDKFDLGLSQKELVVLFREYYLGLVQAEKGVSINDSKFGALYQQYFDQASELISPRENIQERLKNRGFFSWNEFAGRRGDYQFTQLGKVPVGAATLEKFAEIQLKRLLKQHDDFETPVIRARNDIANIRENIGLLETITQPPPAFWRDAAMGADWKPEAKRQYEQNIEGQQEKIRTALADLNIYRAQLRRVFGASLYFLEIKHAGGTLYKVGISNRDIEARVEEIKRDLAPHLSGVKVEILRRLKHRGAIEFYFKHRYRHEQHKLGSLTEYFIFEDRKKILSDLTRLGDYTPDDFMQRVIEGKPSATEVQIIEEKERLIAEYKKRVISEARSEATKAGMQRAAEQGIHVGRPKGSKEDEVKLLAKYPEVVELLRKGRSLRDIGYKTGVAVNTIRKVKAAMEG